MGLIYVDADVVIYEPQEHLNATVYQANLKRTLATTGLPLFGIRFHGNQLVAIHNHGVLLGDEVACNSIHVYFYPDDIEHKSAYVLICSNTIIEAINTAEKIIALIERYTPDKYDAWNERKKI